MSDDERTDLLELKASVERHLLTLHDETIELSPYEDALKFDALIGKAKYCRGISDRIDQQLADQDQWTRHDRK